ncbi:MAG: polyprenyl synthetase family protein [Tannerellaceae bacterium]|nr:polyprenyl synthetase family protein [Tannerellaceae bacterium]
MYTFEEILNRVENEVSNLTFPYSPKSLYSPIEYILALGGKRIRPALTLIGCNIFKENIDLSIQPAMALEVFHNFTLLHDDLMDNADIRRKQPTVHKKWNDNTAILSGDAMLIVSYKLITEVDHPYAALFIRLFSQMALEICGGQQFDMEFETRSNVSENEYLEMIRLKTAVLLATGLKIGALAGGANEQQADILYQYGINIGLAFQLKDDLLDTYGGPATFGKNIGGDILCNKKTYLLIQAFQNATPEQRTVLEKWIEQKEFDPAEKIKAFKRIYDQLQVKAICEEKAEYFYKKAQDLISSLQVPEERLAVLQEVSNRLMFRES